MRFRREAEISNHRWKMSSPLLPDEARQPGPVAGRGSYDHCLPQEYAIHNLLPDARAALEWFNAAGIPWHASVAGGPTNNLLSSQIQCVNALAPFAHDRAAIRQLFGSVLSVDEPLAVGVPEAPDALVGFEFTGDDDPLNEWAGGSGTRGAMSTSADGVIRFRTPTGTEELVLIEWKYVEDYSTARYDDAAFATRISRYGDLLADSDGPIRTDLEPADLFCEPVYQLMRLQLLAHVLESRGVADRVRLLVCAPARNGEYWNSLPDRLMRSAPDPVSEAQELGELWRACLTRPDRFAVLDTAVFVSPGSPLLSHYKDRYGHLDERDGREHAQDDRSGSQ